MPNSVSPFLNFSRAFPPTPPRPSALALSVFFSGASFGVSAAGLSAPAGSSGSGVFSFGVSAVSGGFSASRASTVSGAIKELDGKVDTLTGEGEGSVKKALVDAKAYTDGKIADLDSTASGGTQGVEISVGQTDGKLKKETNAESVYCPLHQALSLIYCAKVTVFFIEKSSGY